MRNFLTGLSAIAMIALSAPAAAADLGAGFSVSGNVSGVSDYRFRGLSLSNHKPTVQAGLNLNHESGLYASLWSSGVTESATYGRYELDAIVGYGRDIAPGTSIDINATFYTYPDSDKDTASDYVEIMPSIKHDFGPMALKVGGAIAPKRAATGDETLLYGYGEISAPVPNTPVTLRAHFGRQDLGFAAYNDWQIGAEASFGPVAASLSYVDTNIGRNDTMVTSGYTSYRNARAGIVFSLGVNF